MTSSRADGSTTPPTPRPTRRRTAASLERIADLSTVALALLLTLGLLWLLSDVVLVLFAATLLACQLAGAAALLSRHARLPHGLSLALVILVLCAAAALFSWWHGPDVAKEATIIYDQVRSQLAVLWGKLGNIDALKGTIDRVKGLTDHLSSHLAGNAAGYVTSALGGFGTVLLIAVAGVYFAASPSMYVDGLLALMPHGWREHGRAVLVQEGRTLRWWFIGQFLDMAAVGGLTGLGLLLLGVKLSLTLALIAAVCNFVPYIGALAGAVPAVLVALSDGPRTALYVALLFVAVQTLEGNVIAPLIQKRTVELPPIVTLLSQTVLGTLFGPMGLILATPITATALVIVKMVYREKILGDAIEHQC